MKIYDDKLIEKVYRALYGKMIGVRYGAPIEMWTREQILERYSEDAVGYLVDYSENNKVFSADDDINGPVFFLKILDDYKNMTVENMGKIWKRYISTGHGFFWWGGYGISTEETAYRNLTNGIPAKDSGNQKYNGVQLSSQIGGQIFSDFWGLLFPYNIKKAAKYGYIAAKVSHDLDALEGAKFIPAMVSAAFTSKNVYQVIKKALSVLDKEKSYYKAVVDIIAFHKKNKSQKECFRYIKDNYWRDKFGGNCHIIPNIAIMIMSLLYGDNDFDKTLKICNFAGFDTDCNLGNLGVILAVLGVEIKDYWTKPINDLYLASSVVGYLNIIDIPNLTYEISRHVFNLNDQEYKGNYDLTKKDSLAFDFRIPNATHGFIYDAEEKKFSKKTYYRPVDLYDNRYFPCFSPLVYPNQSVEFIMNKKTSGYLYYHDINEDIIIKQNFNNLDKVSLFINKDDACVGEVGIAVIDQGVKLLNVEVFGTPKYKIDFIKTPTDEYDFNHVEPRGFTHDLGYFICEDNKLHCSAEEIGTCFTGKYKLENTYLSVYLELIKGKNGIIFAAKGKNEYYLLKNSNGFIEIVKVFDSKQKVLAKVKYKESVSKMTVSVSGNLIEGFIDNKKVVETKTDENLAGLVGIYVEKGVTKVHLMEVEERK